MEVTECVACGSLQWDPVEEWHGFEIVHCRECGLSFTINPDYSREKQDMRDLNYRFP
jgi:transcription elongation factor Elf1